MLALAVESVCAAPQQMGSTPVIEDQCESHIRKPNPEHPIHYPLSTSLPANVFHFYYTAPHLQMFSMLEKKRRVVDHTSGWFTLVSDYDLPDACSSGTNSIITDH